VGRAIAKKRHGVVLATKGTLNFADRDPNAGGNSRKALARALDESLQRLGTDYIDLYWLHVHDGVTPVQETLRVMDDAVRAGKIRYVGVSNYPARKVVEWQMLARQHNATPIIAAQYQYNLLTRDLELEHVPTFEEFGIGQAPWGPLAQGVLGGKYSRENRKPAEAKRSGGEMQQARLNDRAFDVIDALGAVAKELGSTHARVALAWLRERRTVISPIVGCRTLAHLEDAIASLAVELPPTLHARLDTVSKTDAPYPWSFIQLDRMDKVVRGGMKTTFWRG
jgi:aryl-alcohol dehydrogenase-like predicted oxidoreductase